MLVVRHLFLYQILTSKFVFGFQFIPAYDFADNAVNKRPVADVSGSGEQSCPLCGVVLPIGVLPYHVDECIGATDDVVVVSLYFCYSQIG